MRLRWLADADLSPSDPRPGCGAAQRGAGDKPDPRTTWRVMAEADREAFAEPLHVPRRRLGLTMPRCRAAVQGGCVSGRGQFAGIGVLDWPGDLAGHEARRAARDPRRLGESPPLAERLRRRQFMAKPGGAATMSGERPTYGSAIESFWVCRASREWSADGPCCQTAPSYDLGSLVSNGSVEDGRWGSDPG